MVGLCQYLLLGSNHLFTGGGVYNSSLSVQYSFYISVLNESNCHLGIECRVYRPFECRPFDYQISS
jgi:hypothetical protein